MAANIEPGGGGHVGFVGLLTLMLIGMKILGVLDWSWFWVWSPMIAAVVLTIGLAALALYAGRK